MNFKSRSTDCCRRVCTYRCLRICGATSIRSDKTSAEPAKVHDVHANQIVDWKNPLLDGAADAIGADMHGL